MRLGWIGFSKTERSKVLSVLDLLQDNGTLDELGIAQCNFRKRRGSLTR